ncbi:hypothetical protein FFK22_016925 [Mycobacterium sp. KBS0706]|uniref:hypothetical protein n=1 Tax=Mycobacterium sp. KBS0706 TaxID=2578109 RepID=UPI00110FC1CD|nr:hypothetical protein [Mycobacterium sp. KBS0706]TSD87527.1 hypothetical protein FFK22_016925 [Mycobacterium sp. KBS0706]
MKRIGGMSGAGEAAADESAAADAEGPVEDLPAVGEFRREEVVVRDEELDDRDEVFLGVGIERFTLIGDGSRRRGVRPAGPLAAGGSCGAHGETFERLPGTIGGAGAWLLRVFLPLPVQMKQAKRADTKTVRRESPRAAAVVPFTSSGMALSSTPNAGHGAG